jgi:hypothetical protein
MFTMQRLYMFTMQRLYMFTTQRLYMFTTQRLYMFTTQYTAAGAVSLADTLSRLSCEQTHTLVSRVITMAPSLPPSLPSPNAGPQSRPLLPTPTYTTT